MRIKILMLFKLKNICFIEKLNLDAIHHHHQLSVIQSRDVPNTEKTTNDNSSNGVGKLTAIVDETSKFFKMMNFTVLNPSNL